MAWWWLLLPHYFPIATPLSPRTAEEVGVGSITEFEQFQKTIREKNIGLEGNITTQSSDHNLSKAVLTFGLISCFIPIINNILDASGFVIRFENGEMYKIKTAWYCDLNKTLDLVSRSRSQHGSEMDVWKVILEGTCARYERRPACVGLGCVGSLTRN
jgi:hypothetical protein